jgi:cell division protein FtsQ
MTGSRPASRHPSRRTGRPDWWKAAFFAVAAVALVAGIAWALLGSSFLVLRSVRITGDRQLPRSEVLTAADLTLGTPLIRIDTSAVALRVESLVQVQSARVTRSWPNTIVISITPRRPDLAVPARGGFDLVDPSGVVLGWAAAEPRGFVVLRPPGGVVTSLRGSAAVRAAGLVVRDLPGWLRGQVRSVRSAGPAQVMLTLDSGVTIVWGGPSDSRQKAAVLAILLRTGARCYDVSDPVTAVTDASAQCAVQPRKARSGTRTVPAGTGTARRS